MQIRKAPILMYNGVDHCLGLSAREHVASRVRLPFSYRELQQIKSYNPRKTRSKGSSSVERLSGLERAGAKKILCRFCTLGLIEKSIKLSSGCF